MSQIAGKLTVAVLKSFIVLALGLVLCHLPELYGATTLSIMVFSITTFGIRGLFATLSINDAQHSNTLPFC